MILYLISLPAIKKYHLCLPSCWMVYCWFSQDITLLPLPLILSKGPPICFYLPYSASLLPFTQPSQKWTLRQAERIQAQKWKKWCRKSRVANKKYNIKEAIIVGNWNLILWKNFEKKCKTLASKLFPFRVKGNGVFIHWLPSLTGEGSSWGSWFLPAVQWQEQSSLPENVLWLRGADIAVRSMLGHNEMAAFKDMGSVVLLNVQQPVLWGKRSWYFINTTNSHHGWFLGTICYLVKYWIGKTSTAAREFSPLR